MQTHLCVNDSQPICPLVDLPGSRQACSAALRRHQGQQALCGALLDGGLVEARSSTRLVAHKLQEAAIHLQQQMKPSQPGSNTVCVCVCVKRTKLQGRQGAVNLLTLKL